MAPKSSSSRGGADVSDTQLHRPLSPPDDAAAGHRAVTHPSDQGPPPRRFGPRSAVVAFVVAAIAELGVTRLSSILLSGFLGDGMVGALMAGAVVPFLLAALVVWHVVLGLALGAIFRTGWAMLGVGAGVIVGGALDSAVEGSDLILFFPVAGIALAVVVVLLVLPAYVVGARRGEGKGDRSGSPKLPSVKRVFAVAGVAFFALVALMIAASIAGSAPEERARPSEPADQAQIVTVIGLASVSVEPAHLVAGSVDIELDWRDMSKDYQLEVAGPLSASVEARLNDGDIEWRNDFFYRAGPKGLTTGSWYGEFEQPRGYLGRLDVSPGRYAWLVMLVIEDVSVETGHGFGYNLYELRAWTLFSVE